MAESNHRKNIAALDELRLVNQAQKGDINAFEALYRTTHRRLLMFCYRMIGERSIAEEIVQDAYLKAWQAIGQFKQQSQFYTWLQTIASRLIIDRLRLKSETIWRNQVEWELEQISTRTSPELSVDLDKLILALPNGARNVFILHDIEGYSHKEIGELLSIAEGTSKAQLSRARNLLKDRL